LRLLSSSSLWRLRSRARSLAGWGRGRGTGASGWGGLCAAARCAVQASKRQHNGQMLQQLRSVCCFEQVADEALG
jgi:hypothetical protein